MAGTASTTPGRDSSAHVDKRPREYKTSRDSCYFCDSASPEAKKIGKVAALCNDRNTYMAYVEGCLVCIDAMANSGSTVSSTVLPADLEEPFSCCEQTKFLAKIMADIRSNQGTIPAGSELTGGNLASTFAAARAQASSLSSLPPPAMSSTESSHRPSTTRTTAPDTTSSSSITTSSSTTSGNGTRSSSSSSTLPTPDTTGGLKSGQPAEGQTTPTTRTNADAQQGPAMNSMAAAIIGSIAATAALILLAVGAVCLYRRRRKRQQGQNKTAGSDKYEKPQLHSDHLRRATSVQEMYAWDTPGELAGIQPRRLVELPAKESPAGEALVDDERGEGRFVGRQSTH
ncbi:hypothetical protein MAPG_07051 [Magnaporthiopsis poae ATCC 64411]|uniref:Uncharacterized protein n=1 Tax=Magnaporthiopsis poae (strain ATCC 64411 / 73-15) TaxID=644358 RepID=A0A0C4E3N6_MAGP6|nr:hypothetical protein MAPG_07051 [Magnaporthiopsis poae ATCC 64411]